MLRRAYILTTAERHFGLVLSFLMLAGVSRLLTPAEIGVYAVGSGVMLIALSFREFASPEFLIQQSDVTQVDVRTACTLLLILSLVIATIIALAAPWLAAFYESDDLVPFLQIVAVSGVIESVALPIIVLRRRNLAFGLVAIINMMTAVVTAGVTLILAWFGFKTLSFAWGALCGSMAMALVALAYHGDLATYRPSVASWRRALRFGAFNALTMLLNRGYESLPQLILGRTLSFESAGHYNRASVVCGVPDRLILASLSFVALPAFAAEGRAGRSLSTLYLRSISYITVLYWPALGLATLLAHPIVTLLLGEQWLAIVPLVQIMSLASFFWFPCNLTTPVLLSVGALHDNLVLNLLARPGAAIVLCSSSLFGIMAMALSQFITQPYQMMLSLHFVRRHIPFAWADLVRELTRSALVTVCALCPPSALIAWYGFRFDLPWTAAAVAACGAAVGWLAGLNLTRHQFRDEVFAVLAPLSRFWQRGRLAAGPSRSDRAIAVPEGD